MYTRRCLWQGFSIGILPSLSQKTGVAYILHFCLTSVILFVNIGPFFNILSIHCKGRLKGKTCQAMQTTEMSNRLSSLERENYAMKSKNMTLKQNVILQTFEIVAMLEQDMVWGKKHKICKYVNVFLLQILQMSHLETICKHTPAALKVLSRFFASLHCIGHDKSQHSICIYTQYKKLSHLKSHLLWYG